VGQVAAGGGLASTSRLVRGRAAALRALRVSDEVSGRNLDAAVAAS
jgi:hypothetical protein